MLEPCGREPLASRDAADSPGTMHQIRLALVELRHLRLKIGRVDVDIDRARNVTVVEFLFGAHIQHQILLVGPQLLELLDVRILKRQERGGEFRHPFRWVLVKVHLAIVAAEFDVLALVIELNGFVFEFVAGHETLLERVRFHGGRSLRARGRQTDCEEKRGKDRFDFHVRVRKDLQWILSQVWRKLNLKTLKLVKRPFLFQVAINISLIRWSGRRLASLRVGHRSLGIGSLLAPSQPPPIRRA